MPGILSLWYHLFRSPLLTSNATIIPFVLYYHEVVNTDVFQSSVFISSNALARVSTSLLFVSVDGINDSVA